MKLHKEGISSVGLPKASCWLVRCMGTKAGGLRSKETVAKQTNEKLKSYLDVVLAVILRQPGLRMSLSRMLTISSNFGRLFLSFCQQSNISW